MPNSQDKDTRRNVENELNVKPLNPAEISVIRVTDLLLRIMEFNESLDKVQILSRIAEAYSDLQHNVIFESERLTACYDRYNKLQDEKIAEWRDRHPTA